MVRTIVPISIIYILFCFHLERLVFAAEVAQPIYQKSSIETGLAAEHISLDSHGQGSYAGFLAQIKNEQTRSFLESEYNSINVQSATADYDLIKGTSSSASESFSSSDWSVNDGQLYSQTSRQESSSSTVTRNSGGETTASTGRTSTDTALFGRKVRSEAKYTGSKEWGSAPPDNDDAGSTDTSTDKSDTRKWAEQSVGMKLVEGQDFGKIDKVGLYHDKWGKLDKNGEGHLTTLDVGTFEAGGKYGDVTANLQDGLKASAEYEASLNLVRVNDKTKVRFGDDTGPLTLTLESEIDAGVYAEGSLKGEASIGPEGAKIEAGAEGFVGGKAEIKGATTFLENWLPVKVSGSAYGSAGIGGAAKGTFELSWSKIKIGGELGGAIGLGAGGQGQVEIDISKPVKSIGDTLRKGADAVGNAHDLIGTSLAGLWPDSETVDIKGKTGKGGGLGGGSSGTGGATLPGSGGDSGGNSGSGQPGSDLLGGSQDSGSGQADDSGRTDSMRTGNVGQADKTGDAGSSGQVKNESRADDLGKSEDIGTPVATGKGSNSDKTDKIGKADSVGQAERVGKAEDVGEAEDVGKAKIIKPLKLPW